MLYGSSKSSLASYLVTFFLQVPPHSSILVLLFVYEPRPTASEDHKDSTKNEDFADSRRTIPVILDDWST